jgi:hypothetical protein
MACIIHREKTARLQVSETEEFFIQYEAYREPPYDDTEATEFWGVYLYDAENYTETLVKGLFENSIDASKAVADLITERFKS